MSAIEFKTGVDDGRKWDDKDYPDLNFVYLQVEVADTDGSKFSGWVQPEVATLVKAAPELLDCCNELLGLLQLIEGRCDAELLDIIRTNHRVIDAQAAVARATVPA